MTLEKYKEKIKSLVITRAAIEDQMKKTDLLRYEEMRNDEYSGPATLLYFALFDEKYAINAKLGKIQDQMKKDGFEIKQYCYWHNLYLDLANTVMGVK
ncbi:MAG: hypothetical protein IKT93_02350 [Clostridia bacterium]|nr:hypothetical protein [Clostridia bacterium]